MEIQVYLIYSVFCFVMYFLSHNLNTIDTRIIKLLSGAALIVLGIWGMSIDYYIPYPNAGYITLTKVATDWQQALMWIYAMFGFGNILFGMFDIILWGQDRKRYAEERTF